MSAYYNEIDPYCAEWLRTLIAAGHLPAGEVDTRSIVEVSADDLRGYKQCHFFAGIGGWSYALRLAGWPDDRPVWTGSCPCQPFSAAGKRKGEKDERHLWPEFYRLIKACRPDAVFGEQVASSEVVGTELEAAFVIAVQRGDFARANKLAKRLVASRSFHFHPRWVDGVRADVEAINYTFRHAVLGAHSVGAPHIRQRLFWVADAVQPGRAERWAVAGHGRIAGSGGTGQLADADGGQSWEAGAIQPGGQHGQQPQDGGASGLGDASSARAGRHPGAAPSAQGEGEGQRLADGHQGGDGVVAASADGFVGLADLRGAGLEGRDEREVGHERAAAERGGGAGDSGPAYASDTGPSRAGLDAQPQGALVQLGDDVGEDRAANFWSDFDIIPCTDGKARRTQPGLFPLVNGVSGRVAVVRPGKQAETALPEEIRWVSRVGALRGAGNAIVPQLAAKFIRAVQEVRSAA